MDLPLEIARAVRSAVLPFLGDPAKRGSTSVAVGGDPTFGIDEVAEDAANRVLEDAAGDGLAWYTEDRGLVEKGSPSRLLVVDPIDGTRPAGAAMEAGMVSIASAPYDRDATLGDVDDALLMSIKSGMYLRAKRGSGVRIVHRGETLRASPSPKESIDGAFWTYGFRGRPLIISAIVLEELMDATSVSGGAFELGSATFGMAGVVLGRFDAYIDHGQRMIDEIPETRALFEQIADGAILNNNPYDVAAGILICEEAGCPVTDAAGRSLASRPLVGSGAEYCVSTVASATRPMHAEVISALDRGIVRLRDRVATGMVEGTTGDAEAAAPSGRRKGS
jgi:myo-inositol-1(or 4)-monophosphatase